MKKENIFTISAFNIITDEDVTPMRFSKNYYNEGDATDDAIALADELKDDEDVIEIRIYAGEYEDVDTGNIYGEPFDIFTATNANQEKSKSAREDAGYVITTGLDYYADGE
jgi:hypothetical protein